MCIFDDTLFLTNGVNNNGAITMVRFQGPI